MPDVINSLTTVSSCACSSAKRLSVIIITWNQREMTRSCLDSLIPTLDRARDEVILIDNGSVDETGAMIAEMFPSVIYRRMEHNLGVAPARNRGIALSSGRFVMTLDNDTNVHAADLGAEVEKVFEDYPFVGLFGFRLLNRDGTHQQSARRFPTIVHPICARVPGADKVGLCRRLLNEHMMNDTDFTHVDDLLEVDYVLGANQVMRREMLTKTGAYDDAIFYGPEDFEMCLRVHRAGWRVAWCRRVSITHDHLRITRRFSKTTLRFIAAYLYVFWKYRSAWRISKKGKVITGYKTEPVYDA